MNKYFKEYLKRGMMFAGFGPIIFGIIILIISKTDTGFSISSADVFTGIVSTYLLAFVHAGVSIFNQIEEWGISKSIFFHFTSLYIVYTLCYLINSWIPFDWKIIGIFTAIFIAVYAIIWAIVYFSVRASSKKMNMNLK